MENIENNESQHPVLAKLYEQVADLTDKLAKANELEAQRVQRIIELRNEKFDLEAKVSRVLTEAWEDYDHDTIRHIASELDISLTVRKQYEVNLTFTLDIECEIDEIDGIDPEWFDYSVDESSVVDYSTDVIYSKEIS
jgi:polyhydroxyalkanoate synthesis regulator phasin